LRDFEAITRAQVSGVTVAVTVGVSGVTIGAAVGVSGVACWEAEKVQAERKSERIRIILYILPPTQITLHRLAMRLVKENYYTHNYSKHVYSFVSSGWLVA
jgi:hypothetical protein